MDLLIRLYQLVLITATIIVATALLVSVVSGVPLVILFHLVIFAIPLLLLILFTVLTVEFTPDAVSRGELEGLVGLKRDGVLQRHAARIGPRRSRSAVTGPAAPSDTPLDRLVRAKRALPPGGHE
jgi:energy-coupling factor transporter transmembrane protein EcfT